MSTGHPIRFAPGQRVQWYSLVKPDKLFRGTIVRSLKDGFYLVDDGSGLTPRRVHETALGGIPRPTTKEQSTA